jgi:hypothetical protein
MREHKIVAQLAQMWSNRPSQAFVISWLRFGAMRSRDVLIGESSNDIEMT